MVDTLSLIVSILCAVGSFISFLLAQKEKKEAKEILKIAIMLIKKVVVV